MKIFLFLLFLINGVDDFSDISKINKLKKQAQDAYLRNDFAEAAEKYKALMEDYKIEDENVLMNLANAYYALKDTANASQQYQKAVNASNKSIKSQALTQLGVMAYSNQKLKESVVLFKEALKADPENEAARYNYEVVKKAINKQKEQEQKDEKGGEEDKMQPSDFAKKLKEQADQLVLNRKYEEAFDLMMNGFKQDQTVSYYKDFISRINDIIEIDK